MEQGVARSTVVRHEVIHRFSVISARKSPTQGSSQFIVAQTSSRWVLEVVLQYPEEEHHGEYEARIFQDSPKVLFLVSVLFKYLPQHP